MDVERQARVDLAAMYRLFHHYGWSDLTYTHLSARLEGEPARYLINPYGLLFDEITASNLVLVDFDVDDVPGAIVRMLAPHDVPTSTGSITRPGNSSAITSRRMPTAAFLSSTNPPHAPPYAESNRTALSHTHLHRLPAAIPSVPKEPHP